MVAVGWLGRYESDRRAPETGDYYLQCDKQAQKPQFGARHYKMSQIVAHTACYRMPFLGILPRNFVREPRNQVYGHSGLQAGTGAHYSDLVLLASEMTIICD